MAKRRPAYDGKVSMQQHITRSASPQRVDRALLCSVYEQSRQIASIRVNRFGPLLGDQPCAVESNHPTMQAACAFMLPLVQAYGCGETNDEKELKENQYKRMSDL